MRVVHEIFHAVSEGNKGRLCWFIHTTTKLHGELLDIIAYLDSDKNEATNPVIEVTSMGFFNLF